MRGIFQRRTPAGGGPTGRNGLADGRGGRDERRAANGYDPINGNGPVNGSESAGWNTPAGRGTPVGRRASVGRGTPVSMRMAAAAGNSGIRTGIRWKLSAAIAMVGALVAVALSLVVHNSARVSMLDNSRDLADERITVAERMYESGRTQAFGVKVDDPTIPKDLLAKVMEGRRATYVADRPNGVPDIWAALPLKDGRVLSSTPVSRTATPTS